MTDDDRYAEYLEGGTPTGELDAGARAELDDLRGFLGSAEVWAEPPPDLAGNVVAAIGAARAEMPSGPLPRKPANRFALKLVGAAAAFLLAVAVAGALVATGDDDASGEEFALAATELEPSATGEASVVATGSGLSISLDIEGLPPAEPGFFYQAWMKGDAGSVPIGTFHAREGDGPIELWSGVDVADYPLMTVTIQQEGAGPESSGQVVLSGPIPDVSS